MGALEPVFIENLAEALGEPALLGLTQLHDCERQQQLKARIKEIIASRNYREWCAVFAETDCCVEPVLAVSEAARHPHMLARKMTLDYTTDNGKTIKQMSCPIKFSASEQTVPTPAPATGRDQTTILKS